METFAFIIIPILIIMGLVAYVTNDPKPAGSTHAEAYALGGVTTPDMERGITGYRRRDPPTRG